MLYQITFEEEAIEDIRQTLRWIERNAKANPQTKAGQWFNAMQKAVDSLSMLPFRCPPAPETDLVDETVRQLLFQQYRILYAVRGDTVHNLHMRHQRQQPLTQEDF